MKSLLSCLIRNLLLVITFTSISPAQAEQPTSKFFEEKLSEISEACKDQGHILAEARINRWKREGQKVEERLGKDAYQIISKVMHQQCVSVQYVALLRMIKSTIPTEDARRMNIDGEISRQMDIIEKTL